jgi:hypothetical protein
MTLMDMYSEMGDRIALQYGGSEAHSKMGQSGSSLKGGELLTSIKRYYSNAFTDRVKQDAINLFLGHFVPTQSRVSLWELESDYHLHNKQLRPKVPYSDEVLLSQVGSRFAKCLLDRDEDEDAPGARKKEEIKLIVDSSVAPDLVAKTIERLEYRKRLYRAKDAQIQEAQREWWKLAMHDHDARKMWMRIPRDLDDKNSSHLESFRRVHKLSDITSFDEIIADGEFSNPVVVDTSTTSMLKANAWVDRGANENNTPLTDEGDNGVGMFGKIGQFAGQISQRARNLVGGFLRKEESTDGNIRNRSGFGKNGGDTLSLRLYDTVSVEQDLYAAYVASQTKLGEDSSDHSVRLHEFADAVKDLTIDVNDARGMKELALDYYVGYTCKSGYYHGLEYNDDALLAHGSLHTGLVVIEDTLTKAAMTSAHQESELVLSDKMHERLDMIATKNKLKNGVHQALHVHTSQFLINQNM